MNYNKVFEGLVYSFSRDKLATMFCVSVPTIDRWIKTKEFPKYVEKIILMQHQIDDLKKEISSKNHNIFILKTSITNYTESLNYLMEVSQ